jgi:FKBP-type peptidyl-prolyl cis-trans isomerase (trigger factor)
MSKSYKNVQVTLEPKRRAVITGSIPAEIMALVRTEALAKIKAGVTIDGFRAGNAPETMVASKVGEMKVLEEAAEMALNQAYPEILQDEKVDAIGRPNITITKIGIGTDLEFKIETALAPVVELGDYKKTAEKIKLEKTEPVTEEEIDAVILNLRKDVAHSKIHAAEGGVHTHDHPEIKDEDLPEVNDEFLKLLGGFKDVEDLRSKIRENMAKEKDMKAHDKRRTEIMEEIVKDAKIELPDIIIQAELEKMLGQFKDDVARANVNYEEYLGHIKKTEEDLKKEWMDIAEKRAKSQIALANIAREESLQPSDEEIKKEMDVILSREKDLDRFQVRMFVDNFLTNEMVFKFLEGGEIR